MDLTLLARIEALLSAFKDVLANSLTDIGMPA
jgi:hypothetical protein